MVVCRPNPLSDSFQDEAVIVFEVISKKSRRTDEGEKKECYLSLPALSAYAIVEQSSAKVVVHRRTPTGFVAEVYEGLNDVIPLPEIGLELPLAEIFARIEFGLEPDDEDE
jgi:Uma2 family endonuclease